MADKIDFKKTLPFYRAPKGRFEIIEVPEQRYLMIDGYGDPNTEVYLEAIQALYPVAYALKFASKRELGIDYVVPPLEGLWWAEDLRVFTSVRDKSKWHWTLMILVPEWVTAAMFDAAVDAVINKDRPARNDEVRLQALHEGLCVQTLHIGSYDSEAETLAHLHEQFIPAQGLALAGTHHEIYLSDPRRTVPEKLRTILRQPVSPR